MKNKKSRLSSGMSGKLLFVRDFLLWTFGAALYSIGVSSFTTPSKFVAGGVTGIATTVNHFFPELPVGTVMLVLNIPLFAAAFVFLGKKQFVRSFIATVILSVMIDLFAVFVPAGTQDKLLASIFYGVSSGVGLAIIYIRNAKELKYVFLNIIRKPLSGNNLHNSSKHIMKKLFFIVRGHIIHIAVVFQLADHGAAAITQRGAAQ